jgi:hypothetical protein
MPELNLNTYRHQFARVRRYYDRFCAMHNGAADRAIMGAARFDDVLSFFMHCHHLRDWVKNDSTSGYSETEVMAFVRANEVLAIVADICNGAKHLKRDRPPESGEQPNIREQNLVLVLGPGLREGKADYRVRIEVWVEHKSQLVDAFDVATEAMVLWEEFLSKDPRSRAEEDGHGPT